MSDHAHDGAVPPPDGVQAGPGQERFARRILAERAALLAARRDGAAAQPSPGRRMLVLDVGGANAASTSTPCCV
ncbi:hypothetical protein [Novacetimonas hansenii]|uniref:hypothetical protein n=1 Tax=Novacetimonas hansenii TaxID=436 RepID=UPI003C2C0A44